MSSNSRDRATIFLLQVARFLLAGFFAAAPLSAQAILESTADGSRRDGKAFIAWIEFRTGPARGAPGAKASLLLHSAQTPAPRSVQLRLPGSPWRKASAQPQLQSWFLVKLPPDLARALLSGEAPRLEVRSTLQIDSRANFQFAPYLLVE